MSHLDPYYLDQLGQRLTKFTRSRSGGLCKCPFCEAPDPEQMRSSKRRGYFYTKKGGISFKCHHCGRPHKLRTMLSIFAPDLFRQYIKDHFVDGMEGGKYKDPAPPPPPPPKAEIKGTIPGFKKLLSLPPDHDARVYADARKVPEWLQKTMFLAEVYEEVAAKLGDRCKDPNRRLVVPARSAAGKLLFVQGRAIDKDVHPKYRTTKVADALKIWGLQKADTTKRTWVMEGIFKACHIPNAVALCGSDAPFDLVAEILPNRVWVWDAEYNAQVIKKQRAAVEAGESLVVWTNCPWKSKDIDDMIVKEGATPEEIVKFMEAHTFKGMRALLELNQVR